MIIGIGLGLDFGSNQGATGFAPTNIPNAALWLSGRADKFSDAAGLVPATAPSGRVMRINQPAPLTGAWLAPSSADANRPFADDGAINVIGSGSGAPGLSMVQPAGITLTSNACTLFASIESWQPQTMSQYNNLLLGSDGIQVWGLWPFGTGFRFYYNGGTQWVAGGSIPEFARVVIVVRCSPTNIKIDYTVNGVAQTQLVLTATINTNTVSGLRVGYTGAAATFHGKISDLGAYSRTLSDLETSDLLTGLLSVAAPAGVPAAAPFIGVSGDSISIAAGQALVNGTFNRMLVNIWGTAPFRMLLDGVSGQTLAQSVAKFPTLLAPRFAQVTARKIWIGQIGTNTLSQLGNTPASVSTTYLALCDTARAAGAKVVACTLLPRSDALITNPSWAADKVSYNALIRAATSRWDVLCDFEGVAGMGANGDELNATNYAGDKLHPTSTGFSLLEPAARAAVLAAYALP